MTDAEQRLATRAPFNLEATVRVLQRRPSNRVDVWEPNGYLRALPVGNGHVLAAVTNRGTVDRPDLRLTLLARRGLSRDDRAAQAAEAARRVAAMLGLDVDPRPLARAVSREPVLHGVASALRGLRPPRFAALFETFLNVIPFQQLSLDAGTAIVGRLVERFGLTIEHGGRRFHCTPESGAIAAARPAALRACGLSMRKADALQGIARAIASGAFAAGPIESLSTEDALRLLLTLPGIGPWSAALVLLRGFGRLDVFPPGDVGAQRSVAALLEVGSDELAERVQRFGELKGYLYFLGLGANLLRSGLIESSSEPPARAAGRRHLEAAR